MSIGIINFFDFSRIYYKIDLPADLLYNSRNAGKGGKTMISTKGRYAIRVMIDIAQHDDGHYIPLKDIAERQELSKKYLEIIAKELVEGNLLIGASGKGGGYRLSRKPESYTIGEILDLMEGSMSCVACLADKNYKCSRKRKCPTLPMWKEYDKLVRDFFNSKRLSDFV